MDAGAVLLRREGPVAWLMLNRPNEGNSIDLGVASAFADAARELDEDPTIRILMIGSTGKLFCGGGDVAAVAAAEDPAGYIGELAREFHRGLHILAQSHLITVGVVQGTAAGGGLGLVLNCDYVIASSKARFLSAYSGIGLTPDSGVSYLLPRVIGPRRAVELTVAGRVLDAETAREWGIVNEVCEPEELDSAAAAFAARLAGSPGQSFGETKRMLVSSYAHSYIDHLDIEADNIERFAARTDSRELIDAFAAQRAPSGQRAAK
ncbi:MAG: hypothetical protein JWQ19_2086 [Subtercola sp.]|nr:hypothetical protein [Subtercola sp.]